MAKIRFCRDEAFVRGDLIVQIYVDGVKAGSLIGRRDLEVDIPAGVHTVQARMFGQKGPVLSLDVAKTDLDVSVSGTRTAGISTWLAVTWVAMYLVPGGRIEWLRWVLLAVVMTGLYFWQRKTRPGFLQLSIREHAEAEPQAILPAAPGKLLIFLPDGRLSLLSLRGAPR